MIHNLVNLTLLIVEINKTIIQEKNKNKFQHTVEISEII
jgi:hypothetical protein